MSPLIRNDHSLSFSGLAIFVGAFFYSKKYDVVVPPSIIAYATQVPFVLGLMGISYAIISTSWDEVNYKNSPILTREEVCVKFV